MTRVERFRLAASLCLVGGSIDAAVLAGWAWPRVLSERSRILTSGAPSIVAVVDVKRPPPGGAATAAGTGSPEAAPADTAAPAPPAPAAPAVPAVAVADQKQPAEPDAPLAAPAPAHANAPVGIILFRSRTGKRWSDPNKAFQRIVELAKDDPNLVLQIDGYADSHADHRDNRRLSLRRARRVAMLLQSAGCSPHQIVVRGHGEHRARATGHGRAARRWNRRVEIHVHGRGAS